MMNIEIQLANETTGTWIRTDSLETIATNVRATEQILATTHNRATLDICMDLANAVIAWMDREDLCCDLQVSVKIPGRTHFISGAAQEKIGMFSIENGVVASVSAVR